MSKTNWTLCNAYRTRHCKSFWVCHAQHALRTYTSKPTWLHWRQGTKQQQPIKLRNTVVIHPMTTLHIGPCNTTNQAQATNLAALSDKILREVGIDLSRYLSSNLSHNAPPADSQQPLTSQFLQTRSRQHLALYHGWKIITSLHSQMSLNLSSHYISQPLNFTSRVPPWTTLNPNVIVSDNADITKTPTFRKRELAETAFGHCYNTTVLGSNWELLPLYHLRLIEIQFE